MDDVARYHKETSFVHLLIHLVLFPRTLRGNSPKETKQMQWPRKAIIDLHPESVPDFRDDPVVTNSFLIFFPQ
jgi:hypothetical protein